MAKYVTDTILTYTINQLCARIDANFTKRDEAIVNIELVMAVPTDKVGTSTTLEQCLRITYADNHEQLDVNGDPIEHIIDLSLEALKTSGINFSAWEKTKDYKIGDYVVYDYKLYQANKNHTSSSDFELDKTNWNLIIGGNSYEVSNWETDHDYVVDDKVNNNNIIYKCIKNHHSDLVDFKNDEDNWIIELDKYFSLSQNQYNQMVTDGLITNSNKELFIVNNGTDISSSYEESFINKKDIQVQHNLKYKYPMIRVFDINDNELYMDIEYFSNNLLILHSDVKVSGKVIVTKI